MGLLTNKLAVSNLIKNRKLYYPYALMSVASTALFYIFTSLRFNPHLIKVWGSHGVEQVLSLGMFVVLIAVVLMVLYANGFVMKQRSKELGLYGVLGLEKKHLLYMTLVETLLFALATITAGILLGILLDKLFYAILLKLMAVEVVLVATFQWKSVGVVYAAMGLVYLVISLLNAGRLGLSSTLHLVKDEKRGEKKGRLLWLQTLLGLGILGTAYYLSQTVRGPLQSMNIFFIAVLMVIVATYLLFNAGMISLLRFLQKRPSYYYQPANFISVSNLIFRMRKNAMGLATIAILSTMVLVTLIGSANIYQGGQDIVDTQAPYDITISMSNGVDENREVRGDAEKMKDFARNLVQQLDLPIEQEISYVYRSDYLKQWEGNQLVSMTKEEWLASRDFTNPPAYLVILSSRDYESMTGEQLDLGDHQAGIYATCVTLDEQKSLRVNGQELEIVRRFKEDFTQRKLSSPLSVLFDKQIVLVVKDVGQFLSLEKESVEMGFETSLPFEQQLEKEEEIEAAVDKVVMQGPEFVEEVPFGRITPLTRATIYKEYFAFGGSLFFIGLLLALLFLMATVLVIYYKQLSEGYEDRERFVTMQQIGLDQGQARRSIRKQMMTVFFLPIGVAVLHVVFAYKMLGNILLLMGVINRQQILHVSLLTVVLYVGIYFFVYTLTSRSYHQIVKS